MVSAHTHLSGGLLGVAERSLPLTALAVPLGADGERGVECLRIRLQELIDRCEARFSSLPSLLLSPADKHLAYEWEALKPSLPAMDNELLFEPVLALRHGDEAERLARLQEACSDLHRVDFHLQEKIAVAVKALGSDHLSGEQSVLLGMCQLQTERFQKREPAFISTAELELVLTFWLQYKDGPVAPAETPARDPYELGDSGIRWVKIGGRGKWLPQVRGTRYPNASLFDERNDHYLGALIARERGRPNSERPKPVRQERMEILERFRSEEDAAQLLQWLYKNYPPPKD